MKIFKRTLSVLLAFLMIFSSVSLLASAESDLTDVSGLASAFRTEYYRYDSTKADWVHTDAIKRGDKLQVRIFIESNYEVGGSQIFWVYSKNFMKLNTTGYTVLYCNRFIIAFIQKIHRKQTKHFKPYRTVS